MITYQKKNGLKKFINLIIEQRISLKVENSPQPTCHFNLSGTYSEMEQNNILVKSPLTDGATKRMAAFDVSKVIKGYKDLYNIDVRHTFSKTATLFLYKCIDSDYEFYYPFNLAGDYEFYKQLAIYDWYYIPWKWEHEKSISFVEKAKSILEIGCGSGSFLKEIIKRYPEKKVTGLEITIVNEKEEFILNDTIEVHAEKNVEKYDLVCNYQVLEHVANVKSFLEASLKVLKPGGEMIISVPNNNSVFLNGKGYIFLNMPPHHMGLWDNQSLEFLSKHFSLQIIKRFYEPIQDYHFEWFKNILKEKIRNTNLPILFRISSNNKFMNIMANIFRKIYSGQSIMFVYKKKK